MVVSKYSTVITVLHVLFLLSHRASPLTFDFSSFTGNGNNTLSLEGDAICDGNLLRLTRRALEDSRNVSVGRATYTEPFLFDDFSTSFTFVIDSRNGNASGDGLAFFLAPLGTSLLNSSAGSDGSLGLPVNSTRSNEYPYVAVEFKIFQSENTSIGDLSYSYGQVGIDVSSLDSVASKPWYASMKEVQESNNAKIRYSSRTKNLSVTFTTYDLSGTQVISYLSYEVDLKKYLPDPVVVGFSASTGRSITLHNIISWNFTSTSHLDYDLSLVRAPDLSAKAKPKKHKTHLVAIIGSIVGGFMLVGVLGVGLFNSCKSKVTGENSNTDIHGLRRFSYGEIALATRNFAEGEKLGEGLDGEVYKGFRYDSNSYVTVKRLFKGSTQRKEYKSDLGLLSILNHRNLMNLIGWGDGEQGELLLIFEFTPKGSLDFYLLKAENLLIWEARYKIAKDLASALLFLHQECSWAHGNIQSSNIMLDSSFNAKLGNFLFNESRAAALHSTHADYIGYLDPAYFLTGNITKMSDVYSFGVVALEIACGRKNIDHSFKDDQIILVRWLWELYREGKIIEAADPKLRGDFDKKQMECLMLVGLWCTSSDPRPLISDAIQVLNFDKRSNSRPLIGL